MHRLSIRDSIHRSALLVALGLSALVAGAQVPPEMGAAIPADAGIIVAMPSAERTIGGVMDFVRTCNPDEDIPDVSEVLGDFLNHMNLDAAGGSGILATGPMIIAVSGDMSSTVRMISLSDPGAFRQTISANGYVEHPDTPDLFVNQAAYPPAAIMVRPNSAALMNSRMMDFGALTSPGGSALTDSLAMPPDGSAVVLIDLAGLVEANRARIEPILEMLDMMAAMSQQQQPQPEGTPPGGMPTMLGGVMGMYAEMIRGLLSGVGQVDHMAVTLTPDSTALRVRGTMVFNAGAPVLDLIPRSMPLDPELARSLPPDAVMRFVTSWDSERDPACMAAMAAWCTAALPDDPDSQALAQQFVAMSRQYYEGVSRGTAMGMYPDAVGGFMPATAMVMGSNDPQGMINIMMEMMIHPGMQQMMVSMYGLAPDAMGFEDLGIQTIGGVEARHVRLTGMDEMMRQVLVAQGETPDPVLLEAMSAVDYWFAGYGSAVIMTTEQQPTMLEQIIAGGGSPLTPPASAAEIAQGADLIAHISLGGLLGWLDGSVGSFAPPGQGPPFEAMSEALLGRETGIWGSLTALQGNEIGGALFVPAADIAILIGAAKASSN